MKLVSFVILAIATTIVECGEITLTSNKDEMVDANGTCLKIGYIEENGLAWSCHCVEVGKPLRCPKKQQRALQNGPAEKPSEEPKKKSEENLEEPKGRIKDVTKPRYPPVTSRKPKSK